MILAMALVHLAVVVSPGANFLVVSRNALAYSRQTGLLTARGVALGTLTYVTIGMLGFATIIATSPLLFNLIKGVGAVYFFYVGGKTLYGLRQSRQAREQQNETKDLSRRGAFFSGLVTALSNPTAALYFLSLFTSFVQTTTPLGEKVLTGVILVAISFTWYSIIAATFSNARVRALYAQFELPLNVLIGLLWIGLGIKLLTTAGS
jgi:RhtB (resistance to homoserine/threonine) family protein